MNDKIWNDDCLGREQLSEAFTQIATHGPKRMVASVSAPFGAGKTYFAERWCKHLNEIGVPCAYFDAWNSDYIASPLLAYFDALREQLESSGDDQTKQKIAETVSAALPVIKRVGLRTLLRAATLGASDGEIDEVHEVLTAEASAEANNLISKLDDQRSDLETLRRELTQLAAGLAKQSDQDVIVVIDELDRCRPSFALELLENIKHLLSVDGFKIFIFCNHSALESQAERIYGARPEEEGYLRKFFTHRLVLPEEGKDKFVSSIFSKGFQNNQQAIQAERSAVELLRDINLSLRQIERIRDHLEICFILNPDATELFLQHVLVLMAIREIDEDMFYQVMNQNTSFEDMKRVLNIGESFSEKGNFEMICAVMSVQMREHSDYHSDTITVSDGPFYSASVFIRHLSHNMNISSTADFIRMIRSIIEVSHQISR